MYEFYKLPLERAAFTRTISELLEQWKSLCNCAIKYLSPETTEHRVVWRKTFQSSRKDSWNWILLLVELLLSLPVWNAKVEQMFSLMKKIKTDGRSSLSENILSSLVRICIEGPGCENFHAVPDTTLWNNAVESRRPN